LGLLACAGLPARLVSGELFPRARSLMLSALCWTRWGDRDPSLVTELIGTFVSVDRESDARQQKGTAQ